MLAGSVVLCNSVLLLIFEPLLGLVAAAVALVAAAVVVLIGRSMLPDQRRVQNARGRVFAVGVQLFGGICEAPGRVHAEARAFVVWADRFGRR